jgi:hypothetical protein
MNQEERYERDKVQRDKAELVRGWLRNSDQFVPNDHDDDSWPMAWELVRDGVNERLAEEGHEPMTRDDWDEVIFMATWEARDLLNAVRFCTIITHDLARLNASTP